MARIEGMQMAQSGWSPGSETPSLDAEGLGAASLTAVVIGPEDRRRESVAHALSGSMCSDVRQLPFYPELSQLGQLNELTHDVVIVDLDSNPEYALEVVEQLCAGSQATVMVYSLGADPSMMVRCMRAGAREFLNLPLGQSELTEALVRASARRASTRTNKKAVGKLCTFWGAKGGSGVTTVATNFALAAAEESGQRVLLIDLDLPLGDAVLSLGLTPQYSTVDALQNFMRLDANFLSKLLVQHSSGLWVLAGPGKLIPVPLSTEAVDKLITVARQDFEYVVVDTGSRFDLTGTALFDPNANVYLVSQVTVPELRNSNRLASDLFAARAPKFEIVLNRFSASTIRIDDEQIAKILTRKPQWKIPNDYPALREVQNNADHLALNGSEISKVIRQMARAACGLPDKPAKDKKKKNLISLF